MGIYKETIRKYMIGHQAKQVVSNNGVLDLEQYYLDATAVGATQDKVLFEAELNALPALVKNEADFILVAGINKTGRIFGINGATKSLVEFIASRAGQATYFDKNGVIQIAATNQPRVDFDPLTGFCNGYLLEGAKTNLIPNSQVGMTGEGYSLSGAYVFDVAWSRGGSLLQKGFRFNDTSAVNLFAYVVQQLEVGKIYTFSAFIRTTSSDPLAFGSADPQSPLNDFNIYLNSFTNPLTYKSVYLGDNTHRVSVTVEHTAAPSPPFNVGITQRPTNNRLNFTVTGYQLEIGKFATSYIPTTGAASVRAEDAVSSADGHNLFAQNKGSVFVNHSMQLDQAFSLDYLYIGSTQGRFCTPSAGQYRAYDGTNLVEAPVGSFVGGQRARFVTSYGQDGLKLQVNNLPTSVMPFDGVFGTAGQFVIFKPAMGQPTSTIKVKAIAGFSRQLTNEESELITS